ncbi:MAG: hypothetical protein ABI746_13630 [Dermatophilaceae bacterium]
MTENGDQADQTGGPFTQPMGLQQPSTSGYVAPIPPVTDWNATQWDPSAHGASPATQSSSAPVPLGDPRQQAPYHQAPYPPGPYPQQQVNVATTVIVAGAPKSVGIALLLTFFFGPLGMLYSTVTGAVVMVLVNLLVGLLTYGFGLFLTWPICMIWAATAASSRNARAGTVRVVPSRLPTTPTTASRA